MKKWIAVVFCEKIGENRVIASFLVFHASNRFQAHRKMLEELPSNPEYLDESGTLRPHRVLDLKCIKDHEEDYYRAKFVDMIDHVFYSDRQFIPRNSA